jgi:outer membrane protein assembly factor BamB
VFAGHIHSQRQETAILELSSAETGAARWTFDLPSDVRPPNTIYGSWNRRNAFAAGRLLLATTDGVVAIDTENGRKSWEWEPGTSPDSLSLTCNAGVAVVVVTPRSDRDRWFVVGLDAHSGAQLWRTGPMDASVQRMPLLSSAHVAFVPQSGQKAVVVHDLFTGARTLRFELDTTVSATAEQDAWIEGDRLIVPGLNEVRFPDRNRVVAFDLRSGARLWRVPFDEPSGGGRSASPVKRSLQGVLQQGGRTWFLLQAINEQGAAEKSLYAFDTRIGALTPLHAIRMGGSDGVLGMPRASRVEMPVGPIMVLSPRVGRGQIGEARLRCIDLDRGELWAQALGFDFDELVPGVLPMPALSDTAVAVSCAITERERKLPGVSAFILFFDVKSGLSGGKRDLPRMEKDIPQLFPLGDTLLVRTKSSLEILK